MRYLANSFTKLFGFTTNRRIIVFESDDWGALRAPSKKAYQALKAKSISVESHFNQLDTIASGYDVERLADVLLSYRDNKGNHPSFTALCIMANPDFERIQANKFKYYFYKVFTESQKEIYPNEDVIGMWKKAVTAGVFMPQLHGREHLNASVWLSQLQKGDYATHEAFNSKCWGIGNISVDGIPVKYIEAFNVVNPKRDLEFQEQAIREAVNIFKETIGFFPSYFVAPNGPFSFKLMPILHELGIKQTVFPLLYKEPLGYGKKRIRFCIPGRKVFKDIITIPRNAHFEPHLNTTESVKQCLAKVHLCFKNKIPCVISTHRINYVSKFSQQNADVSLSELKNLLTCILSAFPDVEFLNSIELGELIRAR